MPLKNPYIVLVDMTARAESRIQPQVQCDPGIIQWPRTEMAHNLILHYGMVAGRTVGEITELLSPDEVVQRAFGIVDAYYAEIEKRGWFWETRKYEDLVRELEAEQQGKRQQPGFTSPNGG